MHKKKKQFPLEVIIFYSVRFFFKKNNQTGFLKQKNPKLTGFSSIWLF
jgi:hypothetical protein